MICWSKLRNSIFCMKLARLVLVGFWIPIMLSLAFSFDAHAAESNITMSMGRVVELPLLYGEFNSAGLDISVSTTSSQGYIISLEVRGTSNELLSTSNSSYTIPTITLPNGTESITSSDFSHGYGYSTDGQHFKPIPDPESEGEVMWETKQSDAGVPDDYTLTFGAKVSEDIKSGEYVQTFIITAISNGIHECPVNSICYSSNASEIEEKMENQSLGESTTATLQTPNYRRSGYGFAGWNTEPDGTGTDYGPNETITVGDLSEDGLTLYAKWVESVGTIQNWQSCWTMSIGQSIALTDARDGNTYTVTKLADGKCWMTENLRLDLSDSNLVINKNNTNNPTDEFIDIINTHSTPVNSFCTNNTTACINSIGHSSNNLTSDEYYYYGSYYNWYTATAGNGKQETSSPGAKATGDLCPKGWYLPTGYGSSSILAKLNSAISTGLSSSVAAQKWRAYPNNFLLSGQYKMGIPSSYGESGNYLSSTVSSSTSVNNLWIQPGQVKHASNGSSKINGQSIRCVADNSYTVKFDKNNSSTVTGVMNDQEVEYGVATALNPNQFSIESTERTRYSFKNWNTKADGTGDTYTDKAKITNLSAIGTSITLYAQWERVDYVDVEVIFQPDEVTKVDLRNSKYGDQSVTESGTVVTLAAGHSYQISLSLDAEYDFDHWETSTNGVLGAADKSITTYTVSNDATLTANTKRRDGGKLYLQRVTLASCPDTATIAIDQRDDKEYLIKKMADGKCWMLDNLRLNPNDLIEDLTFANTNMPVDSTFKLPAAGFTSSYAEPKIDVSKENVVQATFEEGSGKIGIYYNYCAATAGTLCSDDSTAKATHDICPAGWRIPDGTKSTGEYKKLYVAYSSKPANLISAFAVPMTGYFDAATLTIKNPTTITYIWSDTAYNRNKSYSLSLGPKSGNPEFGGLRSNGFPVRCVLN